MITLNDLNVGTGLTAYGVHCTVEITIPEQDYIIARLDNGQVVHISSESLAMFPERYVLDITRKQSITGNSLIRTWMCEADGTESGSTKTLDAVLKSAWVDKAYTLEDNTTTVELNISL